MVCQESDIASLIPAPPGGLTGYERAVELAPVKVKAGGVGLRRGRRNPDTLHVGEALDWWRVEALDDSGPERLLRLRAEMRLPGQGWLELGVRPGEDGTGAVLTQRAIFVPRGLAGQLYWWGVSPFHGAVFSGMVRNLVGAAENAL